MSPVSDEPLSAFIRRMTQITTLARDAIEALDDLVANVRDFEAHQDVVRQGDTPSQCCVLLRGWVSRNKVLNNGRRQITAFHYPGAVPDLQSIFLPVMDHNITTVGRARIGFIPHAGLHAVMDLYPRLAEAFWQDTLIDAAIAREWEVNLGSRSAIERIAHLYCESFMRLEWIGEASRVGDTYSFNWPINQAQLGEATGISPVHVNRSMQELRSRGLIATESRDSMAILDMPELIALSGFNPDYLLLGRPAH